MKPEHTNCLACGKRIRLWGLCPNRNETPHSAAFIDFIVRELVNMGKLKAPSGRHLAIARRNAKSFLEKMEYFA